jgi:hypothetical protein
MEFITVSQVNKLFNSIFIRLSLSGSFIVLFDSKGNTFDNIQDAAAFARLEFPNRIIELANFEQALQDNAQWDNL